MSQWNCFQISSSIWLGKIKGIRHGSEQPRDLLLVPSEQGMAAVVTF